MKKLHLMLLLLAFPKSKKFNHSDEFAEFIDNLVNLKYNPIISLSQRGKETWKRGSNGERGLDLFLQQSVLQLD
ncbi:TPA: hypothetical protein ACGGHE_000303 [Bacillus pseudomycoides]